VEASRSMLASSSSPPRPVTAVRSGSTVLQLRPGVLRPLLAKIVRTSEATIGWAWRAP
jgi:hypothetical protein